MIQVTFAALISEQPSLGTGFHLDGEYAGYLGQDANGAHFVYFYRPFWHNTRIREARGYVMVTGSTAALSLVRRLVTRLAYRQLVSRARSICNSPCASSFYQRVLADVQFQRRLAYALIDPAFPLARVACSSSPTPQATPTTRAFFLPKAISRSLLNAHRSNAVPTTTTRNTQ